MESAQVADDAIYKDDDVLAADLHLAQAWARGALTVRARGGGAHAAHVTASAELPLPPPTAFQLMSHPDNAAIFRGIERCTFRRILWSAAGAGRSGGRQTVEVENESDWHFLWFKGSIRTRMVVQEDPSTGTIVVRLAPSGGTAPLQHMHALWRFLPGSTPSSCQVSLEQEVHPKGLPPIFFNGFRAMAAMQVRKTFEDLYAEAQRMNAGRPTLAPYAAVARKEVGGADGDGTAPAAAGDPSSVLSAYEDESAASSDQPPSVERRGMVRAGGLRSHPLSSLLDLPCLAGASGATLAAEAAAHAAAAAAEAAAAARALPPATARQRAFALLQKLWVVSNAALGAAPNAVAELEEMAVLI